MQLNNTQRDRAAGVLLGQACGDALGVPYEFTGLRRGERPQMKGGGLGPYAPAEWSDDTQMAVCIAQVAATGADLTSGPALAQVAQAFERWRSDGATDIGRQTASVIDASARFISGSAVHASMSRWDLGREWVETYRAVAQRYCDEHALSAGNGGLMRGGVVGLTRLDDREATAAAARAVAALTHADPLVLDSCVLHAEAIRVAVLEGRLDLLAGLDLLPADRRPQWTDWVESASGAQPASIEANGSTFGALRAAWAAITSTDDGEPMHVRRALEAAVGAGHDTDTVAAIAGAMLGARYGVSGIPATWRRQVHGWPGLRARDLVELSLRTAGQVRDGDWPITPTVSTHGPALSVPAPFDEQLLLGSQAALADTRAHAVVSLSRIGRDERLTSWSPELHVESWLVDSDHPADHNDLAGALHDAADVVAELRAERRTVFLHCVHAHHRTPAVALLYAVKDLGLSPDDAAREVREALGGRQIGGLLWRTALEEAKRCAR